jgi:hypothetical protein
VAIPFAIALGFAIAAVSVMLVQHFGHVTGYWLMAGGLASIGIIAAIVVSVKEHEEEVEDQKAEEADTGQLVSDATAQAMLQAPLALAGALFTAPGGASGAFKVAGFLRRNYPLVVLLLLIGVLSWPTKSEQEPEVEPPNVKPDELQPAEAFH